MSGMRHEGTSVAVWLLCAAALSALTFLSATRVLEEGVLCAGSARGVEAGVAALAWLPATPVLVLGAVLCAWDALPFGPRTSSGLLLLVVVAQAGFVGSRLAAN